MSKKLNKEELSSAIKSGPLAWMARNTVAANLLMVIFLVGGFVVSTQVKQEVFPEFTTDIIQVTVPYPGASPEEVEQGIILSIEDRVRGLEGVKRVTAVANEGVANILVELLTSADPGKVVQDVKNEVDRITSFPEDAERPVVSLLESRKRVVTLVIYGDQTQSSLRDLAERVRDDLIQRPGVTLVELGLAPPIEIAIEVPQDTLREYDLTLDDIASWVRRTALELPGGEVRTEGGQVLLRTKERRDFGSEFNSIPVTTSVGGSIVTLADIATITDGFEEVDQEATFEGLPSILVNVFRVGSETPQSVSKAVRDYIAELKLELPDSIGMKIWEDSSEVYQDRMWLLLKNASIGLVLVLVLLGLFLEPRLAVWVTLGIPISVLGSFLFIPATGASINMISLFAFIVTLGIVVDDAVVTGENIYEKREQGLSNEDASIVGVQEIAMPVTFAVLTNIVAFMPLFFVPGISGKFFRQIPSVVVGVFIISLIESLFVLPAHLSHNFRDRKIWTLLSRPREVFAKRLHSVIHNYYAPAISVLVKNRYLTLSVAAAVLMIAVGGVIGGHVRFSFIPRIDADVVTAQAQLPFGAPIEESRKVQKLLVEAAGRVVEKRGGAEVVEGTYSQIGASLVSGGPGPTFGVGAGSHVIATQVSLVSPDMRDFTGTDFARTWREEVGRIVGLQSLVFKSETGASEGAAIEFNLNHRTRSELEAAAQELRIILENYAGVIDTDDGVSTGKRQLSFKISPEARSLGLSASELGRQVRSSFYGAEALRQQRGRNEVKVKVRLPESERGSLQTLEKMVIRTPSGGEIPFQQAAIIDEGTSYTSINRRDGRRIIAVTADVDELKGNANQIIADVVEKHMPDLQRKYIGLDYSFGGEREAQQESLGTLGVGFLVAMLVIYALLALPFRSYVQPIIVMLAIPFGAIGAIGGHYLLGYGLSIISMFGLIALAGVVVNDSLVLVVTANRFKEEGDTAFEAIQKAGIRRFRPIVLTSLTTFFGLAPMIFETSMQARFLIPMAISIGFGILFATIIILAIVPSVYMVLEDMSNYFASRDGESTPEASRA